MIKKILKKFSLLHISILAAVAGIALACVDIDYPDYPTSYFSPETVNNQTLRPFFLSYHTLYTESYSDWGSFDVYGDNVNTFNQINIDEWLSYLGHTVSDTDLQFILYKARLGQIDTLIFSIKKNGYPISAALKSNTIFKTDKRKALDFLYYTGYAKRCEPYATFVPDLWDDDDAKTNDPRKDKTAIEKLENGGIKELTNAKNDFVKQRYMFQVMRLYYMEGDYGRCISYYNENEKNFILPQNSIEYRAMGYAAGAYYKQGQFANANYMYACIFNEYQPMKLSAYLSFHPQEESDWDKTLAMAKNDNQKIALWELLGIYKDPFRAIKQIYAINPKTSVLDLMLVRLVNTEEENYLPANFATLDMDTVSDNIKSTALSEIVTFIENIADKDNTNKPYEWNLAAGYLGWLNNNTHYNQYLSEALTQAPTDNLVHAQVRLIRLLDKVKQGKAGNKKFENDVVCDMEWLKNGKHDSALRTTDAYSAILAQLASKYNKAGYPILSDCFKGEMDSATIQNNKMLNNIVKYMGKRNKSPFEKFAFSVFDYNKTDLINIQAVNLMYKYDFTGALAKYKESDSAGTDSLSADPFVIHINDCHDCDAAAANGHAGTKRSFVQEMITLEQKVKTTPSDADALFNLANGFYNMSYFGNNRVLYDTKATYMGDAGFGWIDYDPQMTIDTMPVYMNCHRAEEYYVKAMKASKDNEFKAQCCFMAAKCEQNEFFCTKPKGYKGDFKAGTYFALLKNNYANTQYYKEVIHECGYFAKYAND